MREIKVTSWVVINRVGESHCCANYEAVSKTLSNKNVAGSRKYEYQRVSSSILSATPLSIFNRLCQMIPRGELSDLTTRGSFNSRKSIEKFV